MLHLQEILLSKDRIIRKGFHFICELPYRTIIRRTKLSKFRLGVENFVRRKLCPTKFCLIRYIVLGTYDVIIAQV